VFEIYIYILFVQQAPLTMTVLDPKCEKPPAECLGDDFTVYTYNRTRGCWPSRLKEECRSWGYYTKKGQCQRKCSPAPGKESCKHLCA
ncbi:secreted salivary gland peptide, putative, partial [Ixodes scapularis]